MYPQVILLGVALWRRDTSVFSTLLFLCLIGMSISIVHYSEQMLSMIDPLGHDPSVPCDLTGVSCSATHILVYGYITIPMLAHGVRQQRSHCRGCAAASIAGHR